MARPLTRRQLDVLRAVRESQLETGLSPTLEELGRAIGVNRITAYGHVQALLQKGYLENLEPGASRGLDLTESAHDLLGSLPAGVPPASSASPSPRAPRAAIPSGPAGQIPLLGRIAAGGPIEAIEERQSFAVEELLPTEEDTYLLEVEGDSMIEDHIAPGDLVVVRRQRPPSPGDIVVAVLEDEVATLKRWYPEPDGGSRLVPANARLTPFHVTELEVRGVVTGVIRRY